jgi:hypothetical protein
MCIKEEEHMNGYTCTKACTFGGVTYSVGDAIPFEAVLPSREKALIKQGLIAPAINLEELLKENKALQAKIAEFEKGTTIAHESPTGDKNEQNSIAIPITTKEGVLKLVMTPDDIIKAVTTMQLNAEDAAKAVGEIEKEETLILIDALDTRKTVKTAITARVEEMKTGKEGGNKEDKGQGDA